MVLTKEISSDEEIVVQVKQTCVRGMSRSRRALVAGAPLPFRRAFAELLAAAALLVACSPAAPPPVAAPAPSASAVTTAAASATAAAEALAGAPLTPEERYSALAALNSTFGELEEPRRAELAELAIAETSRLRDKARGAERELLERGLTLQRDFRAVRGSVFEPADPQLWKRLIDIDRAWIALYPDEPGPQLALAKTLRHAMHALVVFDAMNQSDLLEQEQEGNRSVKALAERFADNADVQAERGQVCVEEREDRIACMRRFVRCLALDPGKQACAESLAELREAYVAPYCPAADVKPGFRLRVATVKPQSTSKETVTLGTRKLTLEPAFLTAADVEEIRSRPWRDDDGKGQSAVTVIVAAAKLEATRALGDAMRKHHGARIVLYDGARKLGDIPYFSLIVLAQTSEVDWPREPKIEQVCKKLSKRSLPDDLAPK